MSVCFILMIGAYIIVRMLDIMFRKEVAIPLFLLSAATIVITVICVFKVAQAELELMRTIQQIFQ